MVLALDCASQTAEMVEDKMNQNETCYVSIYISLPNPLFVKSVCHAVVQSNNDGTS